MEIAADAGKEATEQSYAGWEQVFSSEFDFCGELSDAGVAVDVTAAPIVRRRALRGSGSVRSFWPDLMVPTLRGTGIRESVMPARLRQNRRRRRSAQITPEAVELFRQGLSLAAALGRSKFRAGPLDLKLHSLIASDNEPVQVALKLRVELLRRRDAWLSPTIFSTNSRFDFGANFSLGVIHLDAKHRKFR
jgi:hypothetical protein